MMGKRYVHSVLWLIEPAWRDMNIFDFAVEKELHAENAYRDLAARTDNAVLQGILLRLADQEASHAAALRRRKWRSGQASAEMIAPVNVDKLLDHVREQFREAMPESEQELYQNALELESESRELYLDLANRDENVGVRDLLLMLAEQEENHHRVLAGVLKVFSSL